jgi:hypothetical protein
MVCISVCPVSVARRLKLTAAVASRVKPDSLHFNFYAYRIQYLLERNRFS